MIKKKVGLHLTFFSFIDVIPHYLEMYNCFSLIFYKLLYERMDI